MTDIETQKSTVRAIREASKTASVIENAVDAKRRKEEVQPQEQIDATQLVTVIKEEMER